MSTFTYSMTTEYDKSSGNNLARIMGNNELPKGNSWLVFSSVCTVYSDKACTKTLCQSKQESSATIMGVYKSNGRFILKLKAGSNYGYIPFAYYKITGTNSKPSFRFTSSGCGKICWYTLPKGMEKKSAGQVVSTHNLSSGNGLNINEKAVTSSTVKTTNDEEKTQESVATAGAAVTAAAAAAIATADDDEDITHGKYAVEATNALIWNVGTMLSKQVEGIGDGYEFENYKNKAINGVKYSSLGNIFGAPYQWLPTTDCRIKGSGDGIEFTNDLETAGYEFADKIISRMPLLYITPGNTTFMGGSKKNYRQTLLTSLKESMGGAGDDVDFTSLKSMLRDYSGKLYTIYPAYREYFDYVNPMCRAGAIFLKITDKQINGINIHKFHWGVNEGPAYEFYVDEDDTNNEDEEATEITEEAQGEEKDTDKTEPELEEDDEAYDKNDGEIFGSGDENGFKDFQAAIYYKNAIPFYINSEASFQESFTNETTDSSLASVINGLSDKAREIQFLLGTASSAVGEAFDRVDDTLSNVKEQINNIVNKVSKGNSIFSTIANSVKTIVSGGRMLFPQIWANSTFSKSYNISIKLTTPSYDRFSWWLNIYVPLCHLAALVLPRSEYVNSYTTPFLIKAFYKGMFNIDMGIITEMSFNRGKEGSWTADGLPTVVDVTFTIQDLYSAMGMTSAGSMFNGSMFKGFTLQNVAELDYLANLCGININQPDIARMALLWATFNITDRVYDFIPNLKLNIGSAIRNRVLGAYNNLWGI